MENEDVKLDNMFIASMVADIIRVCSILFYNPSKILIHCNLTGNDVSARISFKVSWNSVHIKLPNRFKMGCKTQWFRSTCIYKGRRGDLKPAVDAWQVSEWVELNKLVEYVLISSWKRATHFRVTVQSTGAPTIRTGQCSAWYSKRRHLLVRHCSIRNSHSEWSVWWDGALGHGVPEASSAATRFCSSISVIFQSTSPE